MEIDDLYNQIKEMSNFANKELGQNYLINKEIASKMVNILSINNKDNVLEIGSGFASLSIYLLNEPYKTLTLNDIDPRSISFLDDLVSHKKRAYVINKSALKIDVSIYNKIIGNLPYYITNDLLERILTNSNADKYVLMVQKEVINRINAKVGDEEYGPLSILVNSIGKFNKEINVLKTNFLPSPHVDSVIFSITKKDHIKFDKYNFLLFLKRMFLHRRKTIYNNLSLYLMDKEKAKNILDKLKISILIRPEDINPETYLNIFLETK